jgi:type VI secretion system protein ImpA
MPAFVYNSDELLQPISPERPCGADLRYERLFSDVSEARRSDDDLNLGEWAKEEGRKAADWDRVATLSIGALSEKTKDLRFACFLAEAATELDGFEGLRDSLRLITALIGRFWDSGLYPAIEDGDLDFRASAIQWFTDRIPELAGRVPITSRVGAENYGYVRYVQAQQVGSEAAIASSSAEKRETIQGLIRQGWLTLDAFKAALRATKRPALDGIYRSIEEANQALVALEKAADERFGQAAPSFTAAKEFFSNVDKLLRPVLREKLEEEAAAGAKSGSPADSAVAVSTGGGAAAAAAPALAPLPALTASATASGWEEAEVLVRAGQIDRGLSQMGALAAAETSGRARFLRKLTLVDACLNAGRDRLARTVLEELNRQVDEFKLDQWESTEVVGGVWSRLYKIYQRSDGGNDHDAAGQLYNRLCRLDPWQAYLRCED